MGTPLSFETILLRLVVGLVLGGLVGLERELRDKPAGLRTHMMVALGATTFTLVTLELFAEALVTGDGRLFADPLRLVDGIVGGIGFLGAGAIIQSRGSVEGLTTAGSLWLTGAVGIAAGSGAFVIGAVSIALALIVLVIIGRVEHRMLDKGTRSQHRSRATKPRGRREDD
jgi:putative Mg2+ transporter-C (MgtC) family protein